MSRLNAKLLCEMINRHFEVMQDWDTVREEIDAEKGSPATWMEHGAK